MSVEGLDSTGTEEGDSVLVVEGLSHELEGTGPKVLSHCHIIFCFRLESVIDDKVLPNWRWMFKIIAMNSFKIVITDTMKLRT